jgi:hypothetical protein
VIFQTQLAIAVTIASDWFTVPVHRAKYSSWNFVAKPLFTQSHSAALHVTLHAHQRLHAVHFLLFYQRQILLKEA